LTDRVTRHWSRADVRIVTPATENAAASDREHPARIHRVRSPAGRPAVVGALNGAAVALAVRHRPDVVLSTHVVASPASATIQKMLGIPFVQYFHAKEIGFKPGLSRFAARHATTSIVVSGYTAGLLGALGVRDGRMRKLSPGVDLPERSARRPDTGLQPTILTVARLEDRYKGHDVVMRAMPEIVAAVPTAQWVIIGDGPLRAELERDARRLGVADRVHFLGRASDSERDAAFATAHVFAMPSRLPEAGLAGEGFGIVFLEANAHGVPVVAGDVGGALDSVEEGKGGRLVDPTDSVAVARAITGLLMDPKEASALGEAGRVRATDFEWPLVSRRVEDLLLEIAAIREGG
jgi:phosphatidylinositol alpha-1,6-mannosyltransferase